MGYDVAAIRAKLRKQMSGKFSDPDEFRPPKADPDSTLEYRFYILPPLMEGDELKSGVVNRSMDQFFLQHANHWINDKPHPCPRVWDNSECPFCERGFELLRDESIKSNEAQRKQVVSEYMPNSYYMVNVLFSNWSGNPEELRGRIKYFNASKTCMDIWSEALMRDDAGDADDPKAFGVFFDESAAFQFQLIINRKGRNNSYEKSKFLANGGVPTPMAKSPENLEKLLRLRHNLFDKIEMPDVSKLKKIFATVVEGDDSADEGGFDSDEVIAEDSPKASKTTSKPQTEKPKADKPKQEKPQQKATEVVDDDDPIFDDDDPIDSAPKSSSKPSTKAVESDLDDDDDEIDALLSQLDDND